MNRGKLKKKPLELLIDCERVADKILQNKQELLALDKRRQSNREAIRNLNKSDQNKAWITVGPMLVKMEKQKSIDLLNKDQQTIEQEINKLRSEQKVLVNELRDLEHLSPLAGFDLKPLDRQEVSALSANIPGF